MRNAATVHFGSSTAINSPFVKRVILRRYFAVGASLIKVERANDTVFRSEKDIVCHIFERRRLLEHAARVVALAVAQIRLVMGMDKAW